MSDPAEKCPFDHSGQNALGSEREGEPQSGADAPASGRLPDPTESDPNKAWWPHGLNLRILAKNPAEINPNGPDFDYRKAFETLDLAAVKRDIAAVLTDSKPWWPADFGTYAPLVIRTAWHAAGTYRVFDGRGGNSTGQQRFAPLNSWPDNVSTDKGRRILWPVKKKYGRALSWGDLIALAGNVALETMGFPTFGYAGGRVDAWEPDSDVYWGSEGTWLGTDQRYHGTNDTTRELEAPLAATTMGLIYVNPEGPEGNHDPVAAAHDIRETFGRMGMNDEETVALIAGGHTFGKTHGAAPDDEHLGAEPEDAPLEQQGLGWKNDYGTGSGDDAITSGIEVTWTYHPVRWDGEFFHILFGYEWEPVKGEGGHWHWRPKQNGGAGLVPFAHSDRTREPRMLTTDISLRVDPIYEPIARRFKDDQPGFTDAFARAWFKLIHRDLGPVSRYLGSEVPDEVQRWQDPLPPRDYDLVSDADVAELGRRILATDLSISDLVTTAWAAESTFRGSDHRGGANGARIRLDPQRHWPVNEPERLEHVLGVLGRVKADFDAEKQAEGSAVRVSIADLIVLGGDVAVRKAAGDAGVDIDVPFTPGRVDAGPEHTDERLYSYFEPAADGFRNYLAPGDHRVNAEHLLIDRANLLTLSAPELTVLIGGLRVLGANWKGTEYGVFTKRPGQLTNDFFVNLLDLDTTWKPLDPASQVFQATSDTTGEPTWRGTRVDLVFGSNAELRALAEVYAADDAQEKFVRDFVDAWVKVSNLDRFDLQ